MIIINIIGQFLLSTIEMKKKTHIFKNYKKKIKQLRFYI